jgi:hypothetical protein
MGCVSAAERGAAAGDAPLTLTEVAAALPVRGLVGIVIGYAATLRKAALRELVQGPYSLLSTRLRRWQPLLGFAAGELGGLTLFGMLSYSCLHGLLDEALWLDSQAFLPKQTRVDRALFAMTAEESKLASVKRIRGDLSARLLFQTACLRGHLEMARWMQRRFAISAAGLGTEFGQTLAIQLCSSGHLPVLVWFSDSFPYLDPAEAAPDPPVPGVPLVVEIGFYAAVAERHLAVARWILPRLSLLSRGRVEGLLDFALVEVLKSHRLPCNRAKCSCCKTGRWLMQMRHWPAGARNALPRVCPMADARRAPLIGPGGRDEIA